MSSFPTARIREQALWIGRRSPPVALGRGSRSLTPRCRRESRRQSLVQAPCRVGRSRSCGLAPLRECASFHFGPGTESVAKSLKGGSVRNGGPLPLIESARGVRRARIEEVLACDLKQVVVGPSRPIVRPHRLSRNDSRGLARC